MARNQDLIFRVGADISDFEKKFSGLQRSMQNVGKTLTNTGKSLTKKLTVPIVGLGVASVVLAADFEKSMNKVQAMTGATGNEFEALKKQARDLGMSTVHSAKDVADGMSYLAMAGFEVNEIMDAMPAMLDLATAGNLDLASASDIASNVLTGFSLEAKEAGRMADVLAKASAWANTDVGELGDAMSYVAPVAQGAGLSLEETAGAIGLLSDSGIQGSRAGTTLRRIISSLQNPTGATKKALTELGLSMDDVNPSTKSLAEILGVLEDAGMTSSQAMQLVGDIGGPGLKVLLDQGAEGLTNLTEELENSQGSASEMAEIMSGGIYGAFEKLKSAVQELGIQFGEILAPAVHAVADVLQKAVEWFIELDENTKLVIAVILGLVSAIGPVLMVLGLMTTALSGVSLVAVQVIAVVVGVVAVVASLAYAFTEAWESSEEFQTIVLGVWESIKTTFIEVVEVIKEVMNGLWEFLKGVFDIMKEYWDEHGATLIETVTDIFMGVYDIISHYLGIVWEFIQTILDVIFELWDKHGQTVMDTIDVVFGAIWDIIMGVVGGVRDFIQMALDKMTTFWDKYGDKIMLIVRTAMTFIGDFIGKIMGVVKGIFEFVWPTLKDIVSNVWDTIIGVISGAWDVLSGIFGFFVNLLTGDFAGAWHSIKDIITGVWDSILSVIKGAINGIITGINTFIRGMNKISFSPPSWVPVIGGKDFGINIPEIPKLAKGGVAGGATLAEIGEGAHPEMVAPLNDSTMNPFAKLIASHMPQYSDAGQTTVVIDPIGDRPIYLVSPDGRALAEFVGDDVHDLGDRKEHRKKRRPKRR